MILFHSLQAMKTGLTTLDVEDASRALEPLITFPAPSLKNANWNIKDTSRATSYMFFTCENAKSHGCLPHQPGHSSTRRKLKLIIDQSCEITQFPLLPSNSQTTPPVPTPPPWSHPTPMTAWKCILDLPPFSLSLQLNPPHIVNVCHLLNPTNSSFDTPQSLLLCLVARIASKSLILLRCSAIPRRCH